MIFNTTTFLVLGILLREPRSGYDIVKELASFRPAKSSQIYPILAKLEKNGYVDCTQVNQDGKPNKKVYSVTSQGKAKLEEWLDTQPETPVIRDDFLSMLFSVWIKEPETLERLIKGRKQYMEERLAFFTRKRAEMEETFPADVHNFYHWRHCTRLLYNRRIAMTTEEIKWCDEVLKDHALANLKAETFA
jgi:DNA-binding PadR family transcriptional regulator